MTIRIVFLSFLILYSIRGLAEDLAMDIYPSVDTTSSYWTTTMQDRARSLHTIGLQLKTVISIDSWQGEVNTRGTCASRIDFESTDYCDADLIEGFLNYETDNLSLIIGRYSFRMGSGISTNPSQAVRAAMRNEQGPFTIDQGSELIKLSRFVNDELSLGILTIYESDREHILPYFLINYEGEKLQSRAMIGQNFLGQNLSSTPFDFMVLYLEYNIHHSGRNNRYYSDGLLGSRIGFHNIPLSLNLEYIRNAHGLTAKKSLNHLINIDQGRETITTSNRYDYYDHKKPGTEDSFVWGASQWLSRDLAYCNLIAHINSPWSPIIRAYQSLNDNSSLTILGVQYQGQEAKEFHISLEGEFYRGYLYSEYGWVAKRLYQSFYTLRLGLQL